MKIINEDGSAVLARREATGGRDSEPTYGRLLSVSATLQATMPAGPAAATLQLMRGRETLAGADLRLVIRPGEPHNPMRPGARLKKGDYVLSFDLRADEPAEVAPDLYLRLTVAGKTEDVRVDWDSATMDAGGFRGKSFSLKKVKAKG